MYMLVVGVLQGGGDWPVVGYVCFLCWWVMGVGLMIN